MAVKYRETKRGLRKVGQTPQDQMRSRTPEQRGATGKQIRKHNRKKEREKSTATPIDLVSKPSGSKSKPRPKTWGEAKKQAESNADAAARKVRIRREKQQAQSRREAALRQLITGQTKVKGTKLVSTAPDQKRLKIAASQADKDDWFDSVTDFGKSVLSTGSPLYRLGKGIKEGDPISIFTAVDPTPGAMSAVGHQIKLEHQKSVLGAAEKRYKKAPNPSNAKKVAAAKIGVDSAAKAAMDAFKAPVDVLDITARPSYAISGAAKGGLKGALKGLKGQDRTGFTPLVKKAGLKGTAGDIAGFGLDVVTDPTNYITFGASTVAQTAARTAAKKAYKDATKMTFDDAAKVAASRATRRVQRDGTYTEEQAKKFVQNAVRTARAQAREDYVSEAAEAAATAVRKRLGSTADRKGIQVHWQINLPFLKKGVGGSTLGTTTARLPHFGAKAVRESPGRAATVFDALRQFAPDFRPGATIGRTEWEIGRNAARKVRNYTPQIQAEAARVANAARKAGIGPETLRAVEAGDFSTSEARRFHQIMEDVLQTKFDAGTLRRGFEPGRNAVSEPEFRKLLDKDITRLSRLRNVASKALARQEERAKIYSSQITNRTKAELVGELRKANTANTKALIAAENDLDALRAEGVPDDMIEAAQNRVNILKASQEARQNEYNEIAKVIDRIQTTNAVSREDAAELNKFAAKYLGKPKLVDGKYQSDPASLKWVESITGRNPKQSIAALSRKQDRVARIDDQIEQLRSARATGFSDRSDSEEWVDYINRKHSELGQLGVGRGTARKTPTSTDWAANNAISYLKGGHALAKLDAQHYVPHRQQADVDISFNDPSVHVPGKNKIKPAEEKARTIPMSLDNLDARGALDPESPRSFSENAAKLAAFSIESKRNPALANYWNTVMKGIGRQLRAGDEVVFEPGESLIKYDPSRPGQIEKVADEFSFGTPEGVEALSNVQRRLDALIDSDDDVSKYLVVPNGAYDELTRMITDSRAPSALEWVDRAMGLGKKALTVYNPGFHLRNEYGDLRLAQLAGTPLTRGWFDMVRTLRALRKEAKYQGSKEFFTEDALVGDAAARVEKLLDKEIKVGDIKQPMREWISELNDGVINHGQYAAEFSQQAHRRSVPAKLRKKIDNNESLSAEELQQLRSHGFDEPTTRMEQLFSMRENSTRVLTYMAARGRGMQPDDAANWTNRHHIDYGDLTAAEKGIRATLMPFYTFFARNARIQLSGLFQNPGHYANLMKALNLSARLEINPDTGEPYDDYMEYHDRLPEWKQLGLTIPIAGHDINLQLPEASGLATFSFADLPNWADNVAAQINFIAKDAAEALTGQSFDTRGIPIRPTEGFPGGGDVAGGLVPAPSWAEYIPGGKDLLRVQDYTNPSTGEKTLGWDAYAGWGTGLIPAAGMASKTFADKRYESSSGTANEALGLLGISSTKQEAPEKKHRRELREEVEAARTRFNLLSATKGEKSKEALAAEQEWKRLLREQRKKKLSTLNGSNSLGLKGKESLDLSAPSNVLGQ